MHFIGFRLCRSLSFLAHSPPVLLLAAGLTLTGVWAQFRFHDYCMSAEEAVKNGKITHDQASARMRWMKQSGRVLIIVGSILLIVGTMVGS